MPLKQAEAHKKQYDTRILAMFGRNGDNAPYIKIPLAFSAGGAEGPTARKWETDVQKALKVP